MPQSKLCLLSFVVLLFFSTSLAQETTCLALVEDALTLVSEVCSGTSRNQACYGNLTLQAEPQSAVVSLDFNSPGDKANVMDIRALHLRGMDADVSEWGITLMKVQANLPDTLPGQNVTILLFGDVDLRASTETGFAPMQAFYAQTGIGDAACAQAPDSGILIQTPKGVARVELSINEVSVTLGSTIYVHSDSNDDMVIAVLEGEAVVSAFDETQTLPAGARVTVSLDDAGAADASPGEIEPYAENEMQALPLSLLEDPITIAPPLASGDETPVQCTITPSNTVNLRGGPGTNYSRVGSLSAGESRQPDGRAQGIDGFIWWRISDGVWVREDIVDETGNCAVVTVVTDLPPTPTPAPAGTGGGTAGGTNHFSPFYYNVSRCNVHQGYPILSGQIVTFRQGGRDYLTFAEAQAVSWTPIFILDGVQLNAYSTEIKNDSDQPGVPGIYYYRIGHAEWVATPGTHTIYGDWAEGMTQWGVNTTCTFTVE